MLIVLCGTLVEPKVVKIISQVQVLKSTNRLSVSIDPPMNWFIAKFCPELLSNWCSNFEPRRPKSKSKIWTLSLIGRKFIHLLLLTEKWMSHSFDLDFGHYFILRYSLAFDLIGWERHLASIILKTRLSKSLLFGFSMKCTSKLLAVTFKLLFVFGNLYAR